MFSKSAEIEMPPLGGLLVAANREDKMLDRPEAFAAELTVTLGGLLHAG